MTFVLRWSAKLVSTAVQALLTYITVIHYVNTMGFIPTGIL